MNTILILAIPMYLLSFMVGAVGIFLFAGDIENAPPYAAGIVAMVVGLLLARLGDRLREDAREEEHGS